MHSAVIFLFYYEVMVSSIFLHLIHFLLVARLFSISANAESQSEMSHGNYNQQTMENSLYSVSFVYVFTKAPIFSNFVGLT